MALVRRRNLRTDQRGAAILEFSVVAGTMIVMLFGIVEFANLFSQWNSAVKAVQVGARVAATSAPVWKEAAELTGAELEDSEATGGGSLPGHAITYNYNIVCTKAAGCTGTDTIKDNVGRTYVDDAMDVIVFGRDPNNKACDDPPGEYFGMCDIYNRITTDNVRVTYEHTGVGYSTRPGGLVPTITVEIIGLNFQFIFLDDIMGIFNEQDLNQVPIPGLLTTMIAEDMRPGAPTF